MAQNAFLNDPLIFGEPGALRCVLQWRDDYGSAGPVGRTWGDLQLWVDDTLVWGSPFAAGGQPRGLRWSWIDFAEFLAVAWPYLEEEETYPIAFASQLDMPRHPGELRGRAALRRRGLTQPQAEAEAALLDDFLLVHDLGESLKGAFPPSLLLLREGLRMRVATVAREWRLDFARTMDTLQALAEAVLARIETLGDARSTLARGRWHARGDLAALPRLEAATGLSAEVLEQVWPRPFTVAEPLPYPLKAAARMIDGALEPAALRTLLADIEAIPRGPDPAALDEPRGLAAEALRDHQDDTPFLQGYRLAQRLRDYLDQADGRLDPEALLRGWGIDLTDRDLGSERLDAIAVWGQGQRPTVMVNRTGLRSRLPTGRRTTCAHELCHLLVDTDDALPAVEVLGGRVPQPVEQRANAFAAELLLPLAAAGRAVETELAHVHTPDARRQAIEHVLEGLHRHYGVSFETAAWQVKNSGRLAQADEDALQPYLKSLWAPF
jgi:Zn-dependent peptidase ImmA (M78 family)